MSVFAWLRRDARAESIALMVSNLTPVVRHGYRVGVPGAGRYREVINTDAAAYGGSNVVNPAGFEAQPEPCVHQAWSIQLELPPLATLIIVGQAAGPNGKNEHGK